VTNQSSEQNKAIVRRFIEEFQVGGNLTTFDELMDPDFVNHSGAPEASPGPQGVLEQFSAFRQVLSDFDVRVVHQVAEGDLVATHKIFSGVHAGEFLGVPASGQPVELAVHDLLRLRDGRVVEHWGVLDVIPLIAAAHATTAGQR
jgi:predicted ester cyclase